MSRLALIIGAGPAGLTAAYEFLSRTDVVPIVLERSDCLGGISRTVNYKGNRIDIGGHRFFSKSDRVMNWWLQIMPLEARDAGAVRIAYRNQSREIPAARSADAASGDLVMLVRNRKSRIYFQRRLFDYPLSLGAGTIRNLGLYRTARFGLSYLRSLLFPIRHEQNLEQFFINRFGRQLYRTFFKSYTEKVWGVACSEIGAEWGAQRVKGLSILRTLQHILRSLFSKKDDLAQKETETSLIQRFLYPKYGPGQMWEEVARIVEAKGGTVMTNWSVVGLHHQGNRVVAADAVHAATGERRRFEADFFLSTMPVKELIGCLDPAVPPAVREVADGLVYRDFITVGLLSNRLKLTDAAEGGRVRIKDNWIYIQEADVQVGRMQVFNNWSPYLVRDPEKTWIGLEYFCSKGDDLWARSDEQLIALATEEMERLGILDPAEVLDATVIRMEKTYPAYFGTYARFDEIRSYVDGLSNLYLVGRNGMHKYNNQDHSMLTAMIVVDNIAAGVTGKDNVWAVNTEQDYHEEHDK